MAATVAGHALSHRRQAVMDTAAGRDTTATQAPHDIFTFWERHAWLESLVAESMGAFAAHHPPAAQERDPMLLFLAMVWRATVLYLWHTAEGVPAPVTDTDVNGFVGIESSSAQMADRAAQEVLRLMGKMSELNSWKVRRVLISPSLILPLSFRFSSFDSSVFADRALMSKGSSTHEHTPDSNCRASHAHTRPDGGIFSETEENHGSFT